MATKKITITDKLRLDIVERRKNKGISCYELSERSGNGHSKFWLQNIENGKTKKISKEDLVALYMVLDDETDEEAVVSTIERVLNQPFGDTYKHWYDFVNVSKDYEEVYDDDDLMNMFDEMIDDEILDKIRNAFFNMSINQKQAALTVLQNFNYSLYKNPELVFALLNIPVYCVKDEDMDSYNSIMGELLALAAKYNDLAIKNGSMETIKSWQEYDKYYEQIDKQTIQTALRNFDTMLNIILNTKDEPEPDLFEVVNKFNVDVTFMIERGQPNAIKYYLKSFRIHDGKSFVIHIKECVKWFKGFDCEYELSNLYDVIDKERLDKIYLYLEGIGEIRPTLK